MKLLAALAFVCDAHRISEHIQAAAGEPECTLTKRSIPPYENFKVYSEDDPESGLIPQLNVKGGKTEFYDIWEHTNYFKTSEYSFHKVSPDTNETTSCGRFHTYLLGRSADLRVGKAGQRARLIRITSARHGNALNNIPFQVYYVRGKKKSQVYYTIVRKRISAWGFRGALLSPAKLITAATRATKRNKPDVFKIFKGKCKHGGEKPSQEVGCGRQIMTGIGKFGKWGMNWYMGPVTDDTEPEDAVATLRFQSERWGKASLHKKQIFRLGVKKGDVGLIIINAFLADIIRAMESINMKFGHNFWNMDMR